MSVAAPTPILETRILNREEDIGGRERKRKILKEHRIEKF